MKVTHYLPLAAACLMMVGCGTGKQKAEMTAGIQLANLDTTALPGSSFYQYACGGWIESHPLSPEYSQYGSFTELAENNRKQIQGLIEELAATPSLVQAQHFKAASKEGTLSIDYIRGALSVEKPNQNERSYVKWSKYDKYFPKSYTNEQKDRVVEELLTSWARKRQKENVR